MKIFVSARIFNEAIVSRTKLLGLAKCRGSEITDVEGEDFWESQSQRAFLYRKGINVWTGVAVDAAVSPELC